MRAEIGASAGQLSARERTLRVDRGQHPVGRGGERRVHAVARGLDDGAAVRRDRVAQDRVVARERSPHRVGLFLPQARRTLDIGEQERHRSGRCLTHDLKYVSRLRAPRFRLRQTGR